MLQHTSAALIGSGEQVRRVFAQVIEFPAGVSGLDGMKWGTYG